MDYINCKEFTSYDEFTYLKFKRYLTPPIKILRDTPADVSGDGKYHILYWEPESVILKT